MTAPNIIDVISITGVTTFISGISTNASSPTIIVSNQASSNRVLKLNTLMVSNTTNASTSTTVKIVNSSSGIGSAVAIASSIVVPPGSSLAVIGKDTPIYIEENRSITVNAGAANTNSVDVVASYEVII